MKRYSASELAKMHGMNQPKNLLKSFRAHGIRPDANGKWTKADYYKAKEMGALMDKSKLSEQAERAANAPSGTGATLTYMRLQRQVKKLDVEIKQAELEYQKELDTVIEREKVLAWMRRRDAGLGMIVRTWRETETAKWPEAREAIDALGDRLASALAEASEP